MQSERGPASEANRLTDARGRTVEYAIVRSRRRSWAVYARPDGRVEVRIPEWMSDAEARRHAQEHAGWVFRQLDKTVRSPKAPMPVHFADGEQLTYLGETYSLRLRAGLPLRTELKDAEKELWLTLPPPVESPDRVRRQLLDWYAARARELFPSRVEACLARAGAEGFRPVSRLTIRHTRSRWGSCGADGAVMLNSLLVQAPPECVDYVVMHELCHLRELNHSGRFYAILTRLMPDWKVQKERLARISTDL